MLFWPENVQHCYFKTRALDFKQKYSLFHIGIVLFDAFFNFKINTEDFLHEYYHHFVKRQ